MGADAPMVSVVLPTRNRAHCLARAVASVLSQDYEDLELIVVDDGSTDGTWELLRGVADARLRVLQNTASLGPARARNQAIGVAAGGLIAFQDSDDAWLPGKLGHQVRAMAAAGPRCVGVYGPVDMPGIGRIPGPCDEVRSGDLRAVLVRYNVIGLPAALVRSDALRSVGGFDVRLRRVEDWDLFLALSTLGTFEYIDEIMVDVGRGNDRVSDRVPENFEALTLILEKHAPLFEVDPLVRSAHELQLVRHAIGNRRYKRALGRSLRLARHPGPSVRAAIERWRHGSLVGRNRCR